MLLVKDRQWNLQGEISLSTDVLIKSIEWDDWFLFKRIWSRLLKIGILHVLRISFPISIFLNLSLRIFNERFQKMASLKIVEEGNVH